MARAPTRRVGRRNSAPLVPESPERIALQQQVERVKRRLKQIIKDASKKKGRCRPTDDVKWTTRLDKLIDKHWSNPLSSPLTLPIRNSEHPILYDLIRQATVDQSKPSVLARKRKPWREEMVNALMSIIFGGDWRERQFTGRCVKPTKEQDVEWLDDFDELAKALTSGGLTLPIRWSEHRRFYNLIYDAVSMREDAVRTRKLRPWRLEMLNELMSNLEAVKNDPTGRSWVEIQFPGNYEQPKPTKEEDVEWLALYNKLAKALTSGGLTLPISQIQHARFYNLIRLATVAMHEAAVRTRKLRPWRLEMLNALMSNLEAVKNDPGGRSWIEIQFPEEQPTKEEDVQWLALYNKLAKALTSGGLTLPIRSSEHRRLYNLIYDATVAMCEGAVRTRELRPWRLEMLNALMSNLEAVKNDPDSRSWVEIQFPAANVPLPVFEDLLRLSSDEQGGDGATEQVQLTQEVLDRMETSRDVEDDLPEMDLRNRAKELIFFTAVAVLMRIMNITPTEAVRYDAMVSVSKGGGVQVLSKAQEQERNRANEERYYYSDAVLSFAVGFVRIWMENDEGSKPHAGYTTEKEWSRLLHLLECEFPEGGTNHAIRSACDCGHFAISKNDSESRTAFLQLFVSNSAEAHRHLKDYMYALFSGGDWSENPIAQTGFILPVALRGLATAVVNKIQEAIDVHGGSRVYIVNYPQESAHLPDVTHETVYEQATNTTPSLREYHDPVKAFDLEAHKALQEEKQEKQRAWFRARFNPPKRNLDGCTKS